MKLVLLYWAGLLPFVRIPYDVLAAPYMTRDYLRMKLKEAKQGKPDYYVYIPFVIIANLTCKAMYKHLEKRGVFTCYWVINDDDEMLKVMNEGTMQGIMTDRPT